MFYFSYAVLDMLQTCGYVMTQQNRSLSSNLAKQTNLENSAIQQLNTKSNNPKKNARHVMIDTPVLKKLHPNRYHLKQISIITKRLLSVGKLRRKLRFLFIEEILEVRENNYYFF